MKTITKENWRDVDPVCEQMLSLSLEQGSAYPMFPELWLDMILKPQLSEHVPIELHSIFETARGCMAYGYFYYPLFSVGIEQLYKLIDAAISKKYDESGGPPHKDPKRFVGLERKIDWLHGNGLIKSEQQMTFHNTRLMRNELFHPRAQGIMPPSTASSSLGMASLWINELFA